MSSWAINRSTVGVAWAHVNTVYDVDAPVDAVVDLVTIPTAVVGLVGQAPGLTGSVYAALLVVMK